MMSERPPVPLWLPHRHAVAVSALLLFAIVRPTGAQVQREEERLEFFESRIRPVLVENCLSCHGNDPTRLKGELDLRTRESLRRGGLTGAAVVPGAPDQSLLIQVLDGTHPTLSMPPKGLLPKVVIEDFRTWIREGAIDPRESSGSEPAKGSMQVAWDAHWAFQPIARPPIPPIPDATWPKHPIDNFILSRLLDADLQPAADAEPLTLLRRATYHLLGLPPSADQIRDLLPLLREGQMETVAATLLEDPAYGEKQARHWLDLARYSDSNGVDENLAMTEAHRYRDYLVRAFNKDKPYNQFIAEQVAGDLLASSLPTDEAFDALTATGFLALGPKMLAEQDKEKLVMDVVDEQADVLTKAVLGLSVGCARCHDHKFDPISSSDYYALAGIFRSTKTMGHLQFVSHWNERELATPQELAARDAWNGERKRLEKSLEQLDGAILADARHRAVQQTEAYLEQGAALAGGLIRHEAESFVSSNLNRDSSHWGSPDCVILHSNKPGVQFVEWEIPIPTDGRYSLALRYASGESRPMKLLLQGQVQKEKAASEVSGGFHPQHQRWHLESSVDLKAGTTRLRMERSGPVPHLDAIALLPEAPTGQNLSPSILARFALAFANKSPSSPVRLYQDALALSCDLSALPPHDNPVLDRLRRGGSCSDVQELAHRHGILFELTLDRALALESSAGQKDEKSKSLEPPWEELRQALFGPDGLFHQPLSSALTCADAVLVDQHHKISGELVALDESKPRHFPKAIAVSEGKPVNLKIHLRGSHLTLGDQTIPRGPLSLLTKHVGTLDIPPESSGRLQLAKALTDPRNPLTARVMVNRIWAQHFGQGLSRSPSNFGIRGEAPTHPELLDYLADEFMAHGWSIKWLHRTIMSTRAWRMSSVHDPESIQKDPDNRLLHRMSRQRLDAEGVRDAILATSGSLDRTIGGSLLTAKNFDYVTNDQSGNAARYDSPRRALYLPVIRNALYNLFTTFDYNDPSTPIEQRSRTVIGSQALFFLNAPLPLNESRRVAEHVLQKHQELKEAVSAVWSQILHRTPDPEEMRRSLDYIASLSETPSSAEARLSALTSLAQVLYASNEFLYID